MTPQNPPRYFGSCEHPSIEKLFITPYTDQTWVSWNNIQWYYIAKPYDKIIPEDLCLKRDNFQNLYNKLIL